MFLMIKPLNYISPFICFFGFIVMRSCYDWYELISHGIPWDFAFTVYCVFNQTGLLLYLFYFYSICFYLRLKLNRNHLRLTQIIESNSNSKSNSGSKFEFVRMMKIMHNLDMIYNEINKVNHEFWSIQMVFNLTFNFIMFSCQIYELLYIQLEIMFIIATLYFGFINFFIFVVLISSSASVTSMVNKEYSLVNKLFLVKNKQLNLRSKLKVKQSAFLQQY